MKALQGILGIFLLVSVMAVSAVVFSQTVRGPDAWASWSRDTVVEDRGQVRMISLLLLGGSILYVVLGWRSRRRAADYLAYETDAGSVNVSLQALQDFLGHLKANYPAIESLKPDVDVYQGELDVQLDVRVREGTNVPELCRALQEQAKSEIRDKIGIGEIRDIRVRVQEILVTPAKHRKQENLEIKPERTPDGPADSEK